MPISEDQTAVMAGEFSNGLQSTNTVKSGEAVLNEDGARSTVIRRSTSSGSAARSNILSPHVRHQSSSGPTSPEASRILRGVTARHRGNQLGRVGGATKVGAVGGNGAASFEEIERMAVEEDQVRRQRQEAAAALRSVKSASLDKDWRGRTSMWSSVAEEVNSSAVWDEGYDDHYTMTLGSRSPESVAKPAAPQLRFGQIGQASRAESPGSMRSESPSRSETVTSISSDSYFGRNVPTADEERQEIKRLHDFDNATGISSDDYFGRTPPEPSTFETGNAQDYINHAKDTAYKIALSADSQLMNAAGYIGKRAGEMSSSFWRGAGGRNGGRE
ncbi:uncharacterized protein V1518DRAFT_411440 [Limtongia smithiae]|uniref:uncharacterized protein n=1 Tax=Limtongia smithiae TaxID=1125753 RepID=UPI0034CE3DE2